MDFYEYQELAMRSNQIPAVENADFIVPLLGLVGEAGSLLTEYKKYLRDGSSHKLFKEGIAEELGDLLWYIANLASKFELDLNEIAQDNLKKCQNRWGWRQEGVSSSYRNVSAFCFDHDFPEKERLPRKFELEIFEITENSSVTVKAFSNGIQIGNTLTDNSYSDDGYRFHDIFHIAYAAILGWSPVTRTLLNKRKRKSKPMIDEVEDGGRAIAIEEGISALVFSYAKRHNFLKGVNALDYQLLKTIKDMTSHLEVAQCSLGSWERAILYGYRTWRLVVKNKGGKIIADLDKSCLSYRKL